MECNKSISNREVYSDTSLPQQTRKISNKQPKLTSKATRENTKNKNKHLTAIETTQGIEVARELRDADVFP